MLLMDKEDDCADELRLDPVLSAILGKESLASQPTLSRFFNRMDDDTLRQFDDIMRKLRRRALDLITIIRHTATTRSCVMTG
ncbi:MAG: hypothetical protein HDR23_01205 [Lachnospiraceae bacterium]|nr:hypothetical protein [Lachnospiraceae bacterium]